MIKNIFVLLKVVLLWAIVTSPAFAYIDPGSGMLLWQGVVAAIGAVILFLRNPIQVIKSLIKRLRNK
jgi:hypothetical protein